jgi:hypothetical protein
MKSQNVDLTSVNKEEFGIKNTMTQSTLKGYFVTYAKRDQKNRIFLRGTASHAHWRNVVDSEFLQPIEAAAIAASSCFYLPAQRRIQGYRHNIHLDAISCLKLFTQSGNSVLRIIFVFAATFGVYTDGAFSKIHVFTLF